MVLGIFLGAFWHLESFAKATSSAAAFRLLFNFGFSHNMNHDVVGPLWIVVGVALLQHRGGLDHPRM